MASAPWNIYAEQLLPLGYGHALWYPEPAKADDREVHIGDVGYLHDGQLRPLFNTMSLVPGEQRAEGTPTNRVPPDLAPFDLPSVRISGVHKITQRVVSSQSICEKGANASLAVSA